MPMEVKVARHCPGEPVRVLRTPDLSGGGLLLVIPREYRPPLDMAVEVPVIGTLGAQGEIPPLLRRQVVRQPAEGVTVSSPTPPIIADQR
jgi:hypothetical protein